MRHDRLRGGCRSIGTLRRSGMCARLAEVASARRLLLLLAQGPGRRRRCPLFAFLMDFLVIRWQFLASFLLRLLCLAFVDLAEPGVARASAMPTRAPPRAPPTPWPLPPLAKPPAPLFGSRGPLQRARHRQTSPCSCMAPNVPFMVPEASLAL